MGSPNAPLPETGWSANAAADRAQADRAQAERADVAIVGGGLAGLSLALALRQGLGPDADITLYDPTLSRAGMDDGRCSAIAACENVCLYI